MKNTNIPDILTKARWIWPDNLQYDLVNGYALFRRHFQLATVPRKALLHLTADQAYHLYINGRYVCRGPARGYQKHWPFDSVDVASFLRKGSNLIALRAYNPGCSTFQYVNQGFAGILVAAQWGRVTLLSGENWKCRRQVGIKRDTVTSSLQLFHQESIDLRIEDPEWMQPTFDDKDWGNSQLGRKWNSMPWYTLEPRGIPMLEETEVSPLVCLGEASGKNLSGWENARNLALHRTQEGLVHQPVSNAAPDREILAAGKGKFRSILLDFGKPVIGSLVLEIEGAMGGETIESFHTEVIDSQQLAPISSVDTHCRTALASRLICKAGKNDHTFFHPYGFRYVVLTVRENVKPIRIRARLRTAFYPLEKKGKFVSSNKELMQIWDCCAWTQRICSLDAFVDTPWREQAQWWGDARVQAKNTIFYAGDTRLFRRGIAQIAGQTTPNGLTYGHAPTMAHDCILPDFTLIWLITLWDYYWQTGSTEPFITHQETVEEALAYFEGQLDARTGLLPYDSRYWLFLDWTSLLKEGVTSVYNLWYLIALDKTAELFRLSGKPSAARRLAKAAQALRQALKKFVQADGLIGDGISDAGKRVRTTSIHAQTLASMAGFEMGQEKARIEKVLLPFLREGQVFGAEPSSYWITYVYELLSRKGYGSEVIRHIQRLWEPAIAQGSTVEQFKFVPGDTSHSHAWSAHPLTHMMEILGGIRQTAPAWKKISFAPVFEGTLAEVVIPTPQGSIRTSWQRKPDCIVVNLDLPEGCSALSTLPGIKPKIVTGRCQWKLKV